MPINDCSVSGSRPIIVRADAQPSKTVSCARKSKETYKDSLFSGNSDMQKSPVSAARCLNRLREKLQDQALKLPEENELSDMSTS